MRVHSRWFRQDAARSPDEVAGAMAIISWRIALATIARMRKAGFALEAGPRYFDFLSEALAFAIQLAWREARGRMDAAASEAFAQALAIRVASVLADNQAELLGADAKGAIESRFLARLNARFEEYAAFDYGREGPAFAFLRCFANLAAGIVAEADRRWVHDQVIAIEGPEAAATVASALGALLGTPGARRARGRAESISA
jgi:hypothetical protein